MYIDVIVLSVTEEKIEDFDTVLDCLHALTTQNMYRGALKMEYDEPMGCNRRFSSINVIFRAKIDNVLRYRSVSISFDEVFCLRKLTIALVVYVNEINSSIPRMRSSTVSFDEPLSERQSA